ncbi:MAG: hypothetical protein GF401_03160 [Chitinivibrionales bacterium]|nr:hypothetical protein [Chitinivibrionales bacterium]
MRREKPTLGLKHLTSGVILTAILIGLSGCSSTQTNISILESSKDITELRSALRAIGRKGKRGYKAIPQVVHIVQRHPDSELRQLAIRTLGKIGSEDRNEATRVLCNCIFEPDVEIRRMALVALGDITPFPMGAFPPLIEAMGDKDSIVSKMAMTLLLDYVPHCNHALKNALADQEPKIRSMAALALGHIGYDARFAVPKLKDALDDENPEVREKAREAIDKISAQTGIQY